MLTKGIQTNIVLGTAHHNKNYGLSKNKLHSSQKKIIKFFIKKKLEYLNTHKNFNLPYGLAIQVFYARYLKSIPKKKISKSHYFHVVGPYNQKKNFYKNNEINYKIKRWNKYKKLSIDTLQDYIEIEKIFRKIKSPIKTSWNRLC